MVEFLVWQIPCALELAGYTEDANTEAALVKQLKAAQL